MRVRVSVTPSVSSARDRCMVVKTELKEKKVGNSRPPLHWRSRPGCWSGLLRVVDTDWTVSSQAPQPRPQTTKMPGANARVE
jgi:hypothetical protein